MYNLKLYHPSFIPPNLKKKSAEDTQIMTSKHCVLDVWLGLSSYWLALCKQDVQLVPSTYWTQITFSAKKINQTPGPIQLFNI